MDQTASLLSGASAKAHKTAVRYLGESAADYEAKRVGTAKWEGEDSHVRAWLDELADGSAVLDIPCGTGRFFDYFASRRFAVTAGDISRDMVTEAQKRSTAEMQLDVVSIYKLPYESAAFDAAISIRFMNLIEAQDVHRALGELQRVSRDRVIFTLRVRSKNPSGHYHSPHDISVVEVALATGWRIARNDPVHQEDYRIVEIRAPGHSLD